jgi:pyridoxal phosphate enzyme (YggS family)
MLAVKTQTVESIKAALSCGNFLLGQNRVQELAATEPNLLGIAHATHLIGHLQSNKINQAMLWAACIETVDSLALAQRLSDRALATGHDLDVMVQVNTSAEASKNGVLSDAAPDFCRQVAALDGLRMVGLMTVGLNSTDQVAVGRSYARLRLIRDQVLSDPDPSTSTLTELSMGMSADLEIAVAEGATIVRLGTAVFGPRPG